jgi:histidyl-tRNA synthetase
MVQRLRIIDTVRRVFSRFGFHPLETPAMERIETLMGKYGEEGDKLIFKVLERGEGGKRGEVDQALRYDLTVPLARVVAMHPELPMPFKRSQIQPVWRADRPQKGRYREFYQCDVDTVGAPVGLADAECLAVVHTALSELGFQSFTIRLNDRRILSAMAAAAGAAEREMSMIMAIDKLDKIGRDGVRAEMLRVGLSEEAASRVFEMLDGAAVPGAEAAEADLDRITALAVGLGVPPERIQRDRTLARGLDYYTGTIYETEVTEPKVGSISGGGRYDGLIGMFSGRPIPAVGVSLGLERIFVVMEELGMVAPGQGQEGVYITIFSEEQLGASLQAARAFREAGVAAELHLQPQDKLKKQLKQAHQRGTSHVLVIGPDEAAQGLVQLKDMKSGEQRVLPLAEAVAALVRP